MVDEYILTEAEVCLIKLLETLDKTVLHASCSAQPWDHSSTIAASQSAAVCAGEQVQLGSSTAHSAEHGKCLTLPAAQACSRHGTPDGYKAMSHSSSSSSSSSDDAHDNEGGDVINASSSFALAASGVCQIAGSSEQTLKQVSSSSAAEGTEEDTSRSDASRKLLLHSSASSLAPNLSDFLSSADPGSSHSPHRQSQPNSVHTSCGTASENLACLDKGSAGVCSIQPQQAAAYNLLCNPRAAPQHAASADDSALMATVPEYNQQHIGSSNMQTLIMKAQNLQVS